MREKNVILVMSRARDRNSDLSWNESVSLLHSSEFYQWGLSL